MQAKRCAIVTCISDFVMTCLCAGLFVSAGTTRTSTPRPVTARSSMTGTALSAEVSYSSVNRARDRRHSFMTRALMQAAAIAGTGTARTACGARVAAWRRAATVRSTGSASTGPTGTAIRYKGWLPLPGHVLSTAIGHPRLMALLSTDSVVQGPHISEWPARWQTEEFGSSDDDEEVEEKGKGRKEEEVIVIDD